MYPGLSWSSCFGMILRDEKGKRGELRTRRVATSRKEGIRNEPTTHFPCGTNIGHIAGSALDQPARGREGGSLRLDKKRSRSQRSTNSRFLRFQRSCSHHSSRDRLNRCRLSSAHVEILMNEETGLTHRIDALERSHRSCWASRPALVAERIPLVDLLLESHLSSLPRVGRGGRGGADVSND